MKVEIVNALRNRFRVKDNAVSPVIGTIMMVAVTVVLAATVVAVMNGFGGDTAKAPSNAAFRVQSIDTGPNGVPNGATDTIKITYLTGPNGVALTDVTISVADSTGTAVTGCTLTVAGTWDPGDFVVCNPTTTPATLAGTYFVTVRMYQNALVDQSVGLAE